MNTFKVTRFIIVPTGVYHAPATRHHQVDGRDARAVESFTAAVTEGGQRLNPGTLTQLASKLFVPSASTGSVYVPNSFSEQRFRFLMEISHSDGTFQYLSGYTDRHDHANGYLPHDLELHFNTSSTVRRSRQTTASGQRIVNQVTDSSEILTAPVMNAANAYGGITAGNATDTAVTIRPSDVFAVTESSMAADELQRSAVRQGDTGFKITKVTACDAEFSSGVRKSKTSNASATRYLSDALGAFINAQDDDDSGNAFYSRYDEAMHQLNEPTMQTDRLLTPVSQIGRRLQDGGCVTWKMILDVDPNAAELARQSLNAVNSKRVSTVNGLNAEKLGGNTNEQIAMTRIINNLIAIMSSSLLTQVKFAGRSGITAGERFGMDGPTQASTNNGFVEVLHMRTFDNSEDVGKAKRLAGAILHEVMADVSRNFQRDIAVTVEFDILGDSRISIAMDGAPYPIEFVNPQWCSAKSSLLIGHSQSVLQNMTNDLKAVFRGVLPADRRQQIPQTYAAPVNAPTTPNQAMYGAQAQAQHAQAQAQPSHAPRNTADRGW